MIANTITNNNLTSLLIPSQLPGFIRDDPAYSNFVLFIQAYYEWLETDGNVLEQTKNLLKYKDVDQTTNEFINYFYNDFLSYFPRDILANKVEVLKVAKQLYQSKGNPASFKFLFRILYNSDVDFLNTSDVTLKASSGKWYITKSIKIATDVMYISNITYIGNIITVETVVPHYLSVGDTTTISELSGTNVPNGTWTTSTINSATSYSFESTVFPTGVLGFHGASIYIPNGYVNSNFLKTKNLRLIGETSKTIASIENVVLTITRMEVFISNIERLFESGEYVRVVDTHNNDVLFSGSPLRAKILGQINQIKIDPNNQGSKYNGANTQTGYIGDPIVAYGGLNSPYGRGAVAYVDEVTAGSIEKISVVNSGYGYSHSNVIGGPGMANTIITISNSGGASCHVGDISESSNTISTPTYIPIDSIPINDHPSGIFNHSDVQIGAAQYTQMFANNVSANVVTKLVDAFTFTSFTTGSITSVVVDTGGGGITSSNPPKIKLSSSYQTNVTHTDNIQILADISNLGILSPIQIISAGEGYVANDIITIEGGTGYGANAIVTQVSSTGAILSVSYKANGIISIGGNGYTIGEIYPTQDITNPGVISSIIQSGGFKFSSGLPVVRVLSANTLAHDAALVVPGILGSGGSLNPTYNGVGNILKINIAEYGEDYTSVPTVSLRVQEILVNGVTGSDITTQPQRGDIVYQGNNFDNAQYMAYVDSIRPVITNTGVISNNILLLRVYDYNAMPYSGQKLHIKDKSINLDIITSLTEQQITAVTLSEDFIGLDFNRFNNDTNPGILSYGDGSAKAVATFLNGLTISNGQYLDSTGQPSSFDVLQSSDYNTFTYQLTLDKEIAKYRTTLLKLLHPSGMKVVGRNTIRSTSPIKYKVTNEFNKGYTLEHYTGNTQSSISIVNGTPTNTSSSSNIIRIADVDVTGFVLPNVSTIQATFTNGLTVTSLITDVNFVTNLVDSSHESFIYLASNTWVNIANVANVTAVVGSNIINISSLTNSYNIINNGTYKNTKSPINDIVSVGDTIVISNNTPLLVSGVSNNTITTATDIIYNMHSSDHMLSVNKSLSATRANVVIYGPVV